jgi:4,5-DOPA dioxygenase extradiol
VREEGVLIVSSGNIVHNLRMTIFDDKLKFDWAEAFDSKVKQWILADDHEPLIAYEKQGREAELAINSAEHYLPLLYTLGVKDAGEPVGFFADKVTYGAISMRSVKIG